MPLREPTVPPPCHASCTFIQQPHVSSITTMAIIYVVDCYFIFHSFTDSEITVIVQTGVRDSACTFSSLCYTHTNWG